MTERTDELSDRQWVAIDVAAEALGVTEGQARRISKTDRWRHDYRYPRSYNFADIRQSHTGRKERADGAGDARRPRTKPDDGG